MTPQELHAELDALIHKASSAIGTLAKEGRHKDADTMRHILRRLKKCKEMMQ